MTEHDHHHSHEIPSGARPEDLASCPVMKGNTVDKRTAEAKGLFRDHEGQRYWFCCAACGPLWDAAPDKYVVATS